MEDKTQFDSSRKGKGCVSNIVLLLHYRYNDNKWKGE